VYGVGSSIHNGHNGHKKPSINSDGTDGSSVLTHISTGFGLFKRNKVAIDNGSRRNSNTGRRNSNTNANTIANANTNNNNHNAIRRTATPHPGK
jgi:hypothetical protein